jgi:hypothetical protein
MSPFVKSTFEWDASSLPIPYYDLVGPKTAERSRDHARDSTFIQFAAAKKPSIRSGLEHA